MPQTIERTSLTQLVTNEQYARKVLPFMKADYFSDKTERTVFEEITKFVDKYNKIPTQTSLMEKIKIEAQIQFRAFSQTPLLWVLITLWAMTICLIQNLGSITITP